MGDEENQGKEHKKALHDLMQNQIYTAVLGSIIYMFFDWGYYIFSNFHSIKNFNDFIIKTFYILLLIAFYLSDFYYMKWTKIYKIHHFVFDLIFLFCMLSSIKFINIDTNVEVNSLQSINYRLLKISYLIFFFFYTVWDIIEFIRSKEDKSVKNYYKEVILWEIISLSLIVISFYFKNHNFILIVLILSTLWFCSISSRKKDHKHFRIYAEPLRIFKNEN